MYITVTLDAKREFSPLEGLSCSLHERDRHAFVIHDGASWDGESVDAFSYRYEQFPMHFDLQLSLGILRLDEQRDRTCSGIDHTPDCYQACMRRRENERSRESWRLKARLFNMLHLGQVRLKKTSFDPNAFEIDNREQCLTRLKQGSRRHLYSHDRPGQGRAYEKPLERWRRRLFVERLAHIEQRQL